MLPVRYDPRAMTAQWFLRLTVMAGALIVALPASAQESSFSRAVALQKAGDFEGAAGEYRQFLDAHPDNVEARSNLKLRL